MSSCAALLVVLLPSQAQDSQPVYRNDTIGFEITIPAGWVQVPDSALREGVAFMRRHGATESQTSYVVAFALATARSWFAYPHVLIQVNEFSADNPAPVRLDSLPAWLNAMPPEPTGNRLITRPPDLGPARYDPKLAAVLVRGGGAQLQSGLRVQGYAGIKMNDRALVSVLAYGLVPDSMATEAIRDRFVANLRVEPPPKK